MLKTRGGNRFEGYGNVKLATNHGTRSGWQLTCYECKELSPVIHRTGSSFPPKVLARLFTEKGWKVGNTPDMDVCPACLEKRRQRAKAERQQYAKGSVDRLLDMIRQVDLMLASNVTVDYGPYQPQIAAQLKSLFETAYLCNMLASEEITSVKFWQMPPPLPTLDEVWDQASEEARRKFCEIVGLVQTFDTWEPPEEECTLTLPPDPDPPPDPPAAAPPPTPPAQEAERMSPRTAAFLAKVRKQIFKGAAA
jgi:hypothetical protein